MLKPISPTMHGALDYGMAMGAAAAPSLLKMPARAAGLAYGLAGAVLGMAAFTDFQPSVKRAVPLRAHMAADSALGMALPAMPWVMGFSQNKRARNFFLGVTAMMALSTAMTNWSPRKARRSRRSR